MMGIKTITARGCTMNEAAGGGGGRAIKINKSSPLRQITLRLVPGMRCAKS